MLVPLLEIVGGCPVAPPTDDGADVLAHRLGRHGEVALIDRDGATGPGSGNWATLRRILRAAACRVDGAIGSETDARRLVRAGAHKVVMAPDVSGNILARLPRNRIMATVDLDRCTDKEALALISSLASQVSGFLLKTEESSVEAVFGRVSSLRGATSLPLTLATRSISLEGLLALDQVHVDVQCTFTCLDPTEAFIACMDFSHGPCPAVLQDQSGQVVEVARCDADSLRLALLGGGLPFCELARDRGRLVRAMPDKDRRALLLRIELSGQAFRRGQYSSFGDGAREFFVHRLFEWLSEGRRNPRPGAYVTYLFQKSDRIARKLNEEVFELLTARNHEDVAAEAADVVFFLTAFLVQNGVSLDEVLAELSARER